MKALLSVAAIGACLSLAACTVHQTEAPPLAGPSDLALSLRIEATPDAIGLDGGSQSSVRVTAFGPDGRPISGLTIRMDMAVDGVTQDFGSLSARTIVTGSDGVARVTYTAPAAPPNVSGATCAGLPGTCVTILATPITANFDVSQTQNVVIRLVPLGVILPPAQTPTPAFTFTPSPVNFNIPVTFDASTSCPGPVSNNVCTAAGTITSYQWDFGDGATASGRVANHTFTSGTQASTTFNVTLTVTNDRGISASTVQQVNVGAAPAPSGDWVNSPVNPVVGENVIFNASGVLPAPGHRIVSYSWNFGDGTTGGGMLTTHTFTQPNTYNVVLTVTDEAGGVIVLPHQLTIGTGAPTAAFTASVANAATHTMNFDGSSSSASGGATIVQYQWAFGDGLFATSTTPTVNHTYLAGTGSYSVTLTVTDSFGRRGSVTNSVTVP
jgi:PKD repeat protein